MRRPPPHLAVSESIPSPTGGWNARDALSDMPPEDAVSLENFFPTTTSVNLRNGYTNFATGFGSQVETVMGYNGGATQKLFGVTAAGSIFDATAG